ncbi:response regulator [Thiovibrio frasassiensis]|uniref:Response regulator transcription factor n=1 Tax=Thiovibrio frasassiensis TaxID=2984131 RepID=A0A9X4MIG1_9BACT|nr:response regulator transcription factor [Thiovibrio frasassiensis]MDG4476143.1 response regulator transcription factor [Thiovibrio frasassiensis]
MAKIAVFVADDHSIVREGLREMLARSKDLALVGVAADGEVAVKEIRRLQPDVAILDIAMPMVSGLECIPLIKKDSPGTAIVILSMFAREMYVHQALSAGAHGYVLKTAPWSEILEGVKMVAQGKYFLSREINSELIRGYLNNEEQKSAESSRYDMLSDREQQIFRLVIEGNPTKRIAELLCLSPKTVEKHRSNISKKIGMSEPLAMLKFAMKIGVADPDLWPDS